jgi:hypothetical protein
LAEGVAAGEKGFIGIATQGAGLEVRRADTTLILDFSVSMNNESDLWNNEAYLDSNVSN